MGTPENNTRMTVNGLSMTLHLPERYHSILDAQGNEITQGRLPPSAPQPVYLVDDYIQAPDCFQRSTTMKTSYMIAVKEDRAMWFDFTSNARNTHHVAIAISISGVNALSTMATTSPRLEQYRINCPLHNMPFNLGRHCEQCGFNWPAQNYIATSTDKPFWLDGYRTGEGVTRQFYFSADENRSIAKHVVGSDVPALGFAFYLGKAPKSPTQARVLRSEGGKKSLHVAAGAKISQDIGQDRYKPHYWQDEPAGIIIVNYVDETLMQRIIAGGKKQRVSKDALNARRMPVGG